MVFVLFTPEIEADHWTLSRFWRARCFVQRLAWGEVPDCIAHGVRDPPALHSSQWTQELGCKPVQSAKRWLKRTDWPTCCPWGIARYLGWREREYSHVKAGTAAVGGWSCDYTAATLYCCLPHISVLPDTCVKSYCSIGALQNLLRALLHFSVIHLPDSCCTCFRWGVPTVVRSLASACYTPFFQWYSE